MAKLTLAVIVSVLCGVVIISGFHGSIVYSFLSFALLLALCFTVLPLCRILFGKGAASFLFFFPIGYLIHAFLLSLCGWAFGITPLVFAIYFATSLAISLFFRRRAG